MNGNQKYDLTRGAIINRLLLVALPIVGTQFIQMSYNLTDMFLLGRVGGGAVASSAIAGMYMWLSAGLMLMGKVGAEIGVAQNVGRGDFEAARKYALNAIFMAAALGAAYAAVCLFFTGSLIGFFRVRPAVALDAKRYLSITAMAIPGALISAAVTGAFNGFGNSRAPFFINAAGLLLNVALDPLFIFTWEMGVTGAALATAIAQTAVCLLSLLAITRKKDRPFQRFLFLEKPDGRRIAHLVRWSLPVAVESLLFTAFSMLVARGVAFYGENGLTVTRVGTQIESLTWLLCLGFSTALTAFTGQNQGAGNVDRIRACCRVAFFFMFAWGAAVTLFLIAAGGALFRIFLPHPALVELGASYLKILSLCQIPCCFEAASSGLFRGLGRTLPPSIVSVSSNALRVPLAYALAWGGMGLRGMWLGVALGAVLRGVWLSLWFLREFRRFL
jgi:putative MATE family efflux protein